MAAKNKPNEIYISRLYNAPVKMVWEAWTDPEQVGKWWGPRGFTLTTFSKDVRTGGSWVYTMHGPDGVDYPNKTQFLEVEKYSRMVYDHGANDNQPPMFRVTVTFEEVAGQTRMEMTMALATAEAANETKKFIKKAGGDSTWDRLAEFLEMASAKKDIFVINRTFDAPIDVMFEMFTDPDHFSKWIPPTGSTMQFMKADIRPGGSTFYCMSGNDVKMYGKAIYKEITKPNRIIYSQAFCDENQKIARHPFAPTWPETMLTTVLLEAEAENKTRVCIRWEIEGSATADERDTFNKSKGGMSQGWGGSFEKLEAYLAQRK
jgi:uncharacterized protein YndB with AHSA1/START domain